MGCAENVRDILEQRRRSRAVMIADQTRERDLPGEIDGEKLLIRKTKEKGRRAGRGPAEGNELKYQIKPRCQNW